MSKRVLQSKETDKSKTLTVKLPARLYEELQAFRAELGRVAPHLLFNASALCAEALEEALKRARKELEQLQAEPSGPKSPQEAETGETPGFPPTPASNPAQRPAGAVSEAKHTNAGSAPGGGNER